MVISVRDWAVRFGEASDRDPTIGAMARYFTCRYLWDMGPAKVIVEMRDGRVHSINTDPQPLEPGKIYRFDISIEPMAHRFKAGNRMRLEIVNGDSVVTDVLWTHYYVPSKIGADTIYHSATHPSALILPVMEGA